MIERLRVIDSHTGGEPTRCVVEGIPNLGDGNVADRLRALRREHDRYRTAVIGEPRSPTLAVGAYLLPSQVADYGVIFFNNTGYLGMCGHGTIGVVATLAHLGKLKPGKVSFETPAGVVQAELLDDGRASFDNVPSYRYAKAVAAPWLGFPEGETELRSAAKARPRLVRGEVAYGGNWFFITSDFTEEIVRDNVEHLLMLTSLIQIALERQGITGKDGARIDHIELVGTSSQADARNFVLCPGGEYDRSPCGTGTSAKLACLFDDGVLQEGEVYRVESVIGSQFEGRIRKEGESLIPTITGRANVNGETTLLIDSDDPFAWGIQ